MRKNFSFPIICSLFLTSNYIHAYPEVDVYQLSLENLLEINVVSASRKEEKQHLAPGLVTIVTSQEIETYGARHLRDVIDRLVGIQVIGSHQDFHSKTSMRAINSSHHEDSVLILLNGRPMRQATDGGLNSDLYIGFPLKSIDRIEIIRGPGSVIYGTNAMAGVLNIITRDGKNSVDKTELDISAGTFGMKQAQFSHLKGNKDYSFNIEMNFISADGDPVPGITDIDANIGVYETGVKSNNIFINGRYKNFTLNAMAMHNTQDSASSAFQLPSNPIDLTRYFVDVGYLSNISSNWDISFNYTHSEDTAQWQINETLGDNKSRGRAEMVETILRGKLAPDFNLQFGASHVKNVSGFERGLPPNSTNEYSSAYTQMDYMTLPKQKIIAGLQWNKPVDIGHDLSPRLGLIQGFGENTWLKLLYSKAYRSPNLVETDIDAPQLKGVPTLNPETIETFDAQLIYKTTTRYYAIAAYKSKLENLIVRVPGTPTTHANLGFVDFWGVEMEARMELSKSLNLIGNANYQENVTDSGVYDSTFAPRVMIKFGASYDNGRGMTLAVFNSYFSESTDLSVSNTAPAINPKAEAYNMLTANITIDPGKMWSWGKAKQSKLSLYLDNILDEEVYAPDLNFANANNTIPHHWGRGAYLTYSYKF